jgi:uncharacterized protein YbaP (TraB family)
MKRIITYLAGLLAFIISYTSVAQQKSGPNDKSLLWRISSKKLTKPSYLFGTIHLICRADYLWTEKMKESLAKSDKVCFEMDLDDPSVMMQVAAGMIDNSGKTLADYFTPEQYKLIKNYVKDSLGMDIAMIEKMKPVMLETLISTSGASDCADAISYEDSIMKTALNDKKEVLGLETPEEQLDVMASIPTDTVIKSLLDDIQNHNNNDTEYLQIISAYKKQDLPAIYALLMNTKGMATDMGMFLDERNKKWIPRIDDKMQHSSVFFAVGAGHLWGDNGVINLLRKKGYSVTPMK